MRRLATIMLLALLATLVACKSPDTPGPLTPALPAGPVSVTPCLANTATGTGHATPTPTCSPTEPAACLPLVAGPGAGAGISAYPAPSSGESVGASRATLTPSVTSTPSPTPTATLDLGRCPGLVYREGDRLMLDDEPFVFVGFNALALMDDSLPESELPKILDTLAGWGVTMVRIWVQPSYDLERFERVLDLATSRGLRFVVTLQDYYHYKTAYWFSVKYKTEDLPHIEAVVTRFRERPEIAIWEVMNEPWCGADGEVADPTCYRTLQAWAADTTALIRRLDPCRPISLGLMGARHLPIEVEAYRALNALDTVDILSMHRALGDWYTDPRELEIARELNKPIMLGEVAVVGYGASCEQLGPFVVPERARLVEEDMHKALELGVSGYLLWDYAPGPVRMDDGRVRYYCSVYGYDQNDPIGPLIRALPIPRVPVHSAGD